jgi:hypothetical protein
VTTPGAIPVTIPVVLPIAAVEGLELLHVPPVVSMVRFLGIPIQMLEPPVVIVTAFIEGIMHTIAMITNINFLIIIEFNLY